MESFDTKVMDDFDKYPVYCMQSGPVAKQAVVETGESSGELGTGPQGNDSMVTPNRKRCKLTEDQVSEQKATKFGVTREPNANLYVPLPDFKFMSDGAAKSSGKIITALATTPPAAAAPKQKKGGNKRKAKGRAVKKSVSMTKKKEANHGEPVVELGQGGIMTEKLVYNRAYKRVRQAELKKGSSDEDAKKVAAETARNAVKYFVEKGEDV